MFSLRLLGATDLRDSVGSPVGGLLAQPSRFALLAYLCLRGETMVRRDELLVVFWPELDEARARNALSQALHFLRRTLPGDVVVTRGSEVGIDHTRIRCDANDVQQLVLAGDDAAAVAAYGGELLPAFNINGVPAFERWLDTERSRLRNLAAQAARRASENARANGNLTAAVAHARRLVDIEHDERTLRHLMGLLVADGDRTAALAAYQEFSRRTRDSQEVELSGETLAMVKMLAEPDASAPHSAPRAPPAVAAGTMVVEFDTAGALDSRGITDAEPGVRASPPNTAHYRRTVLFVSAAVVVALGTAWLALRTATLRAASPTVRVAVMPFRIFAAPELGYLSGGMMDVLSLDMDGVGPVQTIDPHAVSSFVAHADTTDQVALGAAAARALSADRFVLGTVIVTGARSRVSATLYDASGRVMTTSVVDVEGTSNVLGATDGLARELLAHELPAPSQGLSRLAALTSSSMPALRHYLDGERYYREGRFDLAAEAFGAAVHEDSTFALGNYRLASSLDWGIHRWEGQSQYDYLDRALRHMHRLGARDQQVIQALHEFWMGSPQRSAQLYQTVLAERPNDVEAAQELGEVTFHRLIYWGSPIAAARLPFERVLRLDPENVNALVHLTRLAALRRDAAATDSLARRALTIAPAHDAAYELRILVALSSRDSLVRAHALDTLRALRPHDEPRWDPVWLAGWRVATFSEDPGVGIDVARVLAEAHRPPASRLLGEIMAAEMYAAMGRWEETSAHLDNVSRLDALLGERLRANITLLGPFAATPARLAQLHAIPSGSAAEPLPPVLRTVTPVPSFARGLEAIATHDSTALHAAEHDLETQPSDAPEAPLARFQSIILQARWLRNAGEAGKALSLLETNWLAIGETSVLHYARSSERLLRADLLQAVGRNREAIMWYESIPEDLGFGLAYAAPAHLGVARAHAALGERKAAAEEYARVAELWQHADGELRQVAAEAARRAARK